MEIKKILILVILGIIKCNEHNIESNLNITVNNSNMIIKEKEVNIADIKENNIKDEQINPTLNNLKENEPNKLNITEPNKVDPNIQLISNENKENQQQIINEEQNIEVEQKLNNQESINDEIKKNEINVNPEIHNIIETDEQINQEIKDLVDVELQEEDAEAAKFKIEVEREREQNAKIFGEDNLQIDQDYDEKKINQNQNIQHEEIAEDGDEKEDHQFFDEEFEKQLGEFEPTEILTINILPKQYHKFYLNITEINSPIKCALFVINEEDYIDFEVIFPNNKNYIKKEKFDHDLLNFDAPLPGIYAFNISNSYMDRNIKVTFAVHAVSLKDEYVDKTYFDSISEQIRRISKYTKSFEISKKTFFQKSAIHASNAKIHNRSIVMFSLIESTVLILIFYFQLKYIISVAKNAV